MLDIRITRLDNQEGIVIITAEVIKPYHDPDPILKPEDKQHLALHTKKMAMFLKLHLGHAILSQTGAE